MTWTEALARSEADLVAGRTVPWAEARVRLQKMLAELEADRTRRQA